MSNRPRTCTYSKVTLIIINRVRARLRVFYVPLLVAACGGASTKPPPAEPVIAHETHSCEHAAHGLEGATRGVREPEQSVFEDLVARCTDDRWPGAAVNCFAEMTEGDLGRCAKELSEQSRDALFGTLAGKGSERAGIAVTLARLEQLNVGIPSCDAFVGAVKTVLACESMSVELRVRLGSDTASFWSLPTDRLAQDDVDRMARVCVESLDTLRREASSVSCAL